MLKSRLLCAASVAAVKRTNPNDKHATSWTNEAVTKQIDSKSQNHAVLWAKTNPDVIMTKVKKKFVLSA